MDIGDIKRENQTYFSPETMKYVKSRVHSQVYHVGDGCWAFVTSEKHMFQKARYYTIRVCWENTRNIYDLSEFQGFKTGKAAHRKCEELEKQYMVNGKGIIPGKNWR